MVYIYFQLGDKKKSPIPPRWWFQPIWNIWVKMGSSSPIFGVKIFKKICETATSPPRDYITILPPIFFGEPSSNSYSILESLGIQVDPEPIIPFKHPSPESYHPWALGSWPLPGAMEKNTAGCKDGFFSQHKSLRYSWSIECLPKLYMVYKWFGK